MNATTALEAIRQRLGPAACITEPSAMAPYLTDSRGRIRRSALAVIEPADTGEVAAVLATCHQAGVAVVPQGGNTGRCAGAVPARDDEGIVLGLRRLNRIRSVDADNFTITVEAGCVLAGVQAAAREAGRLFPLSLGAEGSCQIGGNLATNAGGINVLRYGNARELTLGLEVVLADGSVWDGLTALRKNNTGYDLRDLFIGSEGTLGIITAACLRLFPLPRHGVTAMAALPDAGSCIPLLSLAREHLGETLSSFELMPRFAIEIATRHIPGCRDPFAVPHAWYVLLSADAGAPLDQALQAMLAEALERGVVRDAVIAASGAQGAALRALREGLVEAQRFEGASVKHDVAVPVSRVPEFIDRATAASQRIAPHVRVLAFGHVGDGNVHFNLSRPQGMDDTTFLALEPLLHDAVHDIAMAMAGTFSAEHGIGQIKIAEMARYKSPLELGLLRAIKQVLDPRGILNPGKVLPPAHGKPQTNPSGHARGASCPGQGEPDQS